MLFIGHDREEGERVREKGRRLGRGREGEKVIQSMGEGVSAEIPMPVLGSLMKPAS